jgi:hypothetical protein
MSGFTKGDIKITPHERDDGHGGVERDSDVVAEVNDNHPNTDIKLGVRLGINHNILEFKMNGVHIHPGKENASVKAELDAAYPVPTPPDQKWVGFLIERQLLPAPNQPFKTVFHLTRRPTADEKIRWVVAYVTDPFDNDSCAGDSTIKPK